MSAVLNRSISEDVMIYSSPNVSPSKSAGAKKSPNRKNRRMMNRMSTLDTSDSALSSAESDEDISFSLKLTEEVVIEENPDEDSVSHLGLGSAITSGPRRISIVDPKLKANVSYDIDMVITRGNWHMMQYCSLIFN